MWRGAPVHLRCDHGTNQLLDLDFGWVSCPDPVDGRDGGFGRLPSSSSTVGWTLHRIDAWRGDVLGDLGVLLEECVRERGEHVNPR